MARGASDHDTISLEPSSKGPLSTDEARKKIYTLANEFSEMTEPSKDFLGRAVEFGPRGRGGAVMIPAVDVREMLIRLEEMEDDLEVVGITLLAQERLSEPTPVEDLLTVDDLAREFGFHDLVSE
jgi:hypothetical protein